MNATAPFNQMLLAFWRLRDRESPWGRRGLLALLLLGLAVSLYLAPGLWATLLATSVVLCLGALWMAIFASLLVQNHPHAARFVPGHLHRLRAAALGAWALLSLACTVLISSVLPQLPSAAALLLVTAAALAFAAWAIRHWLMWFAMSFGPMLFFGAGLDRRLAPLAKALQALWLAQPLPVLALSLTMLGWSIARLFGNGDQAHRQSYARRDRMARAAREGGVGVKGMDAAVLGPRAEWLARPFERIYAAWLRHVVVTARPSEASAMQRAEIVLHGRQHWLGQALGTLIGLAIAALSVSIAFALVGTDLHENWKRGAYGMAIGLASMGLNPCFVLRNALWHSRHEQALLRLLPAMPQGRALNRAVARMQLRQSLVAWALTAVGLGLLAGAAGEPALVCLALGALPLSTLWLLRPPARMKAPTAATVTVPILIFMAAAWGMYALHLQLGVPLWAPGGASFGLSLALGLRGWRVVCGAPPALPAGRLG